jgi:6-phosphogluconate dehydrogenase
MQIAMIGLGKMGANMARRLLQGGHHVVVYDLEPASVESTVTEGAIGVAALKEISAVLEKPRAVWVMVPAGDSTEHTVLELVGVLETGDVVIDGGNSNYQDSIRRAATLREVGIHFVDAGVSGGVWGLENGYSMMVGGEEEPVERLRPVFETLAPGPNEGWGHVGPSGAGHYAKMVHNGIEYGLMQAYAEGFEILRAGRFDLDLKQLCDIWNSGGVIRSWLLELAGRAFAEDPELSELQGYVPDSGEGRWTLQESLDLDVPAPVLYASLMTRFRSRQEISFQAKVLAALRHQFGGHATKAASK